MFRSGLHAALLAALLVPGMLAAGEPTLARLENGLEVVLIENHGSPMVTATMIVRTGADNETAASSGASHMMEHLLFNGTERRTQKELYDETDLYGIYSNAATRRFHTDYFVLVARDRIREAMDIQADMLFHSTFPEEKFEKERGIILEEMGKDEQDPSRAAELLFRGIAFAGTPYARPVLGTRESIAAMPREDVVAYHRATYVPNNMVLLVVGDFATAEMLDLVREIYGGAPGAGLPEAVGVAAPSPPAGGSYHLFHGGVDKGHLTIAWEAPPYGHPDSPLFEALTLFASNRLDADLVSGETPVLFEVGAWYERRNTFGRLIVSAAFDPEKDPREVEAAITSSLERLATEGADPDEVRRFRVSLRTDEIYTSEKLHHYGLMKAEHYALGGYSAVEAFLSAVDMLDAADLPEAFARHLHIDRRVAVAFLPGEEDFTQSDLATVIPGEAPFWERDAAPFVPGEFTLLRSSDGGEEKREAREEWADTTLSSGLRVIVKSNDDSEVLAIHLLAKHRSWQEPEGKTGLADLLHRLLLRGTVTADALEQKAALERIGASVKVCDASFIPFDDYYTTPAYSFVRFTTIGEFAKKGLQQFAQMVLHPALADDEVEAMKKQMLMLAQGRSGKASTLCRSLLAGALYKDHPFAHDPEGTLESIPGLTRDDLARFHQRYFGADNLIVTAVTSLPPRAVARVLAEPFNGPLLPIQRKGPPPDPAPTTEDRRVEGELGGTQGAIRLAYVAAVPKEDRAALQVAIALLSDDLAFDLRETRGLAYSVGAGVTFHGEVATIGASMGTSPENLGEAEAGFREHFDKFAALTEVAPRDLERTVNSLIGRMLMRSLSRENQAYRIGLAAFYGEEEDKIEELRGVTAEEVVRAARAYVRSSPSVVAVVR